ncbi:hypothetical protein GE21DRAFT_1045857 [Neurospora crassa]|nr:hypothetical protein GE21DRAFT_1045857 [Neurospora crassa]
MVPAGVSWSIKGRRLPGKSLLPFQRHRLRGPKHWTATQNQKPESYDGWSGPSSSRFPQPTLKSGIVPVKSSRPKSEVPAAASDLPPPPFPSASSHFPHPLLTLHSPHLHFPILPLRPRPRHHPILALTLAQTIPLGSTQFVSGFPTLLLVSLFLPLLLRSLASPVRHCSCLSSVVVCIYLPSLTLPFQRRARDRTEHLQPPIAT